MGRSRSQLSNQLLTQQPIVAAASKHQLLKNNGQVTIRLKKQSTHLTQSGSSKAMLRDISGSELLRLGDNVIYEDQTWECPRTKKVYKLQLSMTKNSNMRINMWKRINNAYLTGDDAVEKVPLSLILTHDKAKVYLQQCEFELDVFARKCLSVHKNGRHIQIQASIVP